MIKLNSIHTPLNILLADDDIDDCMFFKKALLAVPVETDLAIVRDGEELMKYLSDNSSQLPDVLFLDLSMPRKTGIECLSEIKEDLKLKDLPVAVFTTSFGRSVNFEQTIINTLSSIGSLEYIRKPGDIEQLTQIIYKVLLGVIEKRALKSL